MTLARLLDTIKPGLPPWGPHVRFRQMQTLVREGSPLVKLRNSAEREGSPEEGYAGVPFGAEKKTPAQPPSLG